MASNLLILHPIPFILTTVLTFIFIPSSSAANASNTNAHFSFAKETLCFVEEKLQDSCLYKRNMQDGNPRRGSLDCVRQCAWNASCIGASTSLSTQSCYHHQPCSVDYTTNCQGQNQSDHSFYRKVLDTPVCQNGATLDPNTNKCQCTGGWVGWECERYPYSCQEMMDYGYTFSKAHTQVVIEPVGHPQYTVICCKVGTTQTNHLAAYLVFFRHHTASSNMVNMTWQQYADGFNVGKVKWMGLNLVHILSNEAPHNLFLKLTVCNTTSVCSVAYHFFYLVHINFQVSDDADGFRLSYTGVQNQSVGSNDILLQEVDNLTCLEEVGQGRPFSTWDNDQDGDSKNCAATTGMGWWFGSCLSDLNYCRPLGTFYDQPNDPLAATRLNFNGFDTKLHTGLITRMEMFLSPNL